MSEKDCISDNIEDEEEVIPDPNPQLIKLQDLLKQKNTLTRYKDLLEMEDFRNSSEIAIIYDEHRLRNLEALKEKSKEKYLRVIEITSYKNDKNVNKICDLSSTYYVLKGGR